MEELFEIMESYLASVSMEIIREDINRVPWHKRLVAIRGARGVGKTTLILQYIKSEYGSGTRKALYCSLDGFYFNSHSILQLATAFRLAGGEALFLDEVHKYRGWSREVKEIYDRMPDLHIVVTGSSLLNILNSDADLSRRCRGYDMYGLSLREYARFYHGLQLPLVSLEEIMKNSPAICEKVNAKCRPVALFKEYVTRGYYPFFDGDKEDYYLTLENLVNYIVSQEMPLLCGTNPAYARKLKAMLTVVATSVPFEVDISKLAKTLEMARTSVLNYLQQLEKAGLFTLLYSDNLSVKKMQKPDKIYIQNPNLMSALAMNKPNAGTLRETFVVSQLSVNHQVEYGKTQGDFKVDGIYRFEVGGREKDYSQIAGLEDSYLLVDDLEFSTGHKLPIWIMGLIY